MEFEFDAGNGFEDVSLSRSYRSLADRFGAYCDLKGLYDPAGPGQIQDAVTSALEEGLAEQVKTLSIDRRPEKAVLKARESAEGWAGLLTLVTPTSPREYMVPLATPFPPDFGIPEEFSPLLREDAGIVPARRGFERFETAVGLVIQVQSDGEMEESFLLLEDAFQEAMLHAEIADLELAMSTVSPETLAPTTVHGALSANPSSLIFHYCFRALKESLPEGDIPLGITSFTRLSRDLPVFEMAASVAGSTTSKWSGRITVPRCYEHTVILQFGQDSYGFVMHELEE